MHVIILKPVNDIQKQKGTLIILYFYVVPSIYACAYDVLTMLYVIESDYFYLVPSINNIHLLLDT